jgi:hypothetical protein
MTDGEKKAWEVLLENKINPALWKFSGQTDHDYCGASLSEFKNILTGDFLSIERSPAKKKPKGRLFK